MPRYLDAGERLVANIKPALLRHHPRFAKLAAGGLLVADDAGQPVEVQFWDEVGGYNNARVNEPWMHAEALPAIRSRWRCARL